MQMWGKCGQMNNNWELTSQSEYRELFFGVWASVEDPCNMDPHHFEGSGSAKWHMNLDPTQ